MNEHDSSRTWFVHSAEGSCGPYTVDEMREYRTQGILVEDSYVWMEGMAEWQRFADTAELAPPPPAPPAPPPPGMPPPAFAPAPVLSPLPTTFVPARVRDLGAPLDEVTAPTVSPEDDGLAFTSRQLQIGLAGIALALLIIAIGLVPRPCWDEPALALTVFGIIPDDEAGPEASGDAADNERAPASRERPPQN